MDRRPKISVVIPFHWMKDWQFFMKRCLESIEIQTFKDYEVILTKAGRMAENTNAGITCARGEIIKILYLDDYLAHPKALQNLADNFNGGWLATGCVHDWGDGKLINPHNARIEDIIGDKVLNSIGSPSVVAIENKDPLLFDESMTWVLDLDYYRRLYARYGPPTILETLDTAIGCGNHQVTHILSDEEKKNEENYFVNKWIKSQ